MNGRWRDRRSHDEADLNITAFMNLMVILVPFLLITAVFSRMAILELNLPADATAQNDEPEPELQLEVTVRADRLEVGDRGTGLLKMLENTADGYDLNGLSEYLQQVKVRYPDKLDATLLLEPQIDYEVLVSVMDTLRVAPVQEVVDGVRFGELFPEVSIGDAVALPGMTTAAQNNELAQAQ